MAELAYAGSASAPVGGDEGLELIIESWIRQTTNLGYALEHVRNAFLGHVARRSAHDRLGRVIWLVGNFRPATAAYAQEIEAILGDLNVAVRPLLLDQLKASLPCTPENLGTAALVITVPTRLPEVRALLEPLHCRVAAVAFRVNTDTCHSLAAVVPTERVGIVSTYPEYLQTIVDEVGLYCLTQTPPVSAVLGQDERIRQMLGQIDVLVYASGSEALVDLIPDTVRAIELRHAPEPDSVRRLRPLIASQAIFAG